MGQAGLGKLCKIQDCGCCDQILNSHFRPPRPPGRRFGRVGRGGGGNEIS